MRLIVARCEVRYSGRLDALLPEALRLLMIKSDGSVLVHADTGGYKPQNWMTPPTVIEESDGLIVVRKHAGSTEDRLDITISEVISDVTHDMGEAAELEKDGVERHLQELLADQPQWCGEGFRLDRREWPTDIGPVDLMCRDEQDEWIAVEIKRIGTIDAVEQLTRYLERIRLDPGMANCRGVLAAQTVKPQARVLAESRDIEWVEVDLAVLRGEKIPDLTLSREKIARMSEPIFDKKDQLEQIQSGLMEGEEIIAVYDAIGTGTGFLGMTSHRLIVQDKSLSGKRVAITSIPYRHITTVSAVSKKSIAGSFFGSGEIEIQVGSVDYEVEFRGHEKAHHVHDVVLSRITA